MAMYTTIHVLWTFKYMYRAIISVFTHIGVLLLCNGIPYIISTTVGSCTQSPTNSLYP
jgi:hypothetical protein